MSNNINQDLASSKENKNFNTPLFSTTKQEKTPSPLGPGYCTTSFNKEENEILNEIDKDKVYLDIYKFLESIYENN